MPETEPHTERAPTNVRTGAQLLVECLRLNGVTRAYGVPGESYLDLLDALIDSDIAYITCRQEGGAAMAAAAHGQLTGEPGVCMVTRGPGATNASAGLHIARQGGLPMLLLIGQVPRNERGRGVFQEIDYRRMLSELTKWTEEIDDASRIPEFIARAFTVARTGTPGPVALALPEDMLADPVHAEPIRAARPAPNGPSAEEVEAVRERFAGASRPVIIAGGICWDKAASAALGRFAEDFAVPVAFSFRAQDILDNEHPCAIGPIGIGGNRGLGRTLFEADLILALGARIGSGTSVVEDALLARPAGRTLIHVHPDPEELGRVVVPDLAVSADAPEFARALGKFPVPECAERSRWRQRCRAAFEDFSTPRPDASGYIGRVAQALREALPDNAIATNCSGNFPAWLHRYYRYRGPGTGIAPVAGAMGYGLPAALAAALERPETPVVAWLGDGSMMMTGQEMATAVQYGARFTVVVGDNASLATIRMHQERRFPGRVIATGIHPPDFVAWARSFGVYAERANDLEEFRAALDRCLAEEGPSLIHLPIDPRVLTPEMILEA